MYKLRFNLSLRIVFGFALLLVSAATLRADDYYTYAYSGSGISGSGQVALTPGGTDGTFLVTYIDGQVNNIAISGLLNTGTYHNNDNLFYAGDSFLDDQGVSFELSDGAQVGIYYNSAEDDYYFVGDGTFQLDTGTGPGLNSMHGFAASDALSGIDIKLDGFTFMPEAEVATTPEPSGLMLLGTGVLATAGLVRRRFFQA